MASLPDSTASVELLYTYIQSRRRPVLSTHEHHVAFMEATHLRHLSPIPDSFLLRCGLSPSYPPPAVRFTSAAHTALASVEEEFFRATHLNFTEFTLLHTYLHTSLLRSRKHTDTHPGRSTRLTTADQLLLWLFYLCGDRTSQLIIHFGYLNQSTIFRYIDHVTWCMNDMLDECIAWPTAEEKQSLYGMMSVHQHAIAVLDGTHCRLQAPRDCNNLFFSGYKHMHTQNYLVCVDYLGMVRYIEGPWEGRPNDRACYNECKLSKQQAEFLSGEERILADGGFVGGPGLLVPIHQDTYSQPMDEQAREGMMDYNQEFTANRLIVEDVFGWLKERACVLNRAWARHRDRQGPIFYAACKLHNFSRMIRIDYALQRPQH